MQNLLRPVIGPFAQALMSTELEPVQKEQLNSTWMQGRVHADISPSTEHLAATSSPAWLPTPAARAAGSSQGLLVSPGPGIVLRLMHGYIAPPSPEGHQDTFHPDTPPGCRQRLPGALLSITSAPASEVTWAVASMEPIPFPWNKQAQLTSVGISEA